MLYNYYWHFWYAFDTYTVNQCRLCLCGRHKPEKSCPQCWQTDISCPSCFGKQITYLPAVKSLITYLGDLLFQYLAEILLTLTLLSYVHTLRNTVNYMKYLLLAFLCVKYELLKHVSGSVLLINGHDHILKLCISKNL